jgi:type II secretory ATPase GspE/PulE/Tfp pilus assembly ATPase PilB-like protein
MVFSTLHTNSAPDTMSRLLDMGLDPINFADALIGVLAQRLVRTLCENCKEAYKPTEEELNHLVKLYGSECFAELGLDPGEIELMKAVGCDRCLNTGYKGRTGLHEVVLASAEMKKMISQKRTIGELREQAVKEGMRTILQDGIHKIFEGDTDYEQLLRVTSEG